jgi:hypothetical protein
MKISPQKCLLYLVLNRRINAVIWRPCLIGYPTAGISGVIKRHACESIRDEIIAVLFFWYIDYGIWDLGDD